MKAIILMLYFIPIALFSQSKLDSLLFCRLNSYRLLNDVNEITLDDSACSAAKHHTMYLLFRNNDSIRTTIGHAEDVDLAGFEELSPAERINTYIQLKSCWGECVTGTIKRIGYPVEDLVSIILNKWISSVKHNKILISNKYKYGGVSIVVFEGELISTKTDVKIRVQKSFATLILYY